MKDEKAREISSKAKRLHASALWLFYFVPKIKKRARSGFYHCHIEIKTPDKATLKLLLNKIKSEGYQHTLDERKLFTTYITVTW